MTISKIESGPTMKPCFQKITGKTDGESVRPQETTEFTSTQDTTTLSGQAQEKQKAAVHTGMTGNMGAKETRKQDEMERNISEDNEPAINKEGQEVDNNPEPDTGIKEQDYSPISSLYGAIPDGGRNGQIQPDTDTPPGNNPPSAADIAAKQKAVQDDMQQAQTIYIQMAAERQKWLMKMWEIIQDTQTKIMEIMEEAAIKRSKTMDTVAAKWAACLGGYDYK